MIENKQVMAKNILYYMNENNVNATDICKACGFKQNTFSDWVNAKTYPRIDKIELMARYFHISKADLVEERKKDSDNGLLLSVPKEVLNDPKQFAELKDLVETYLSITPEQRLPLVSLLKSLQPKV